MTRTKPRKAAKAREWWTAAIIGRKSKVPVWLGTPRTTRAKAEHDLVTQYRTLLWVREVKPRRKR